MTVSFLRIRWLAVLAVLAIAIVLSACSDSSAPTQEPTATPTPSDVASPVPGTESTGVAIATQNTGGFVSVSAGILHTCGVRTDGSVECWGSNEDGLGNFVGQASPPGGSFASVSAGGLHTCGVRTDGLVECWGSNRDLAGNVVGQATPPGGSFASVNAGGLHTCGVRTDGSVECWGSNEDGLGNFVGQATPPGGSFASVNAGGLHTCGVRTNGSVECWGLNRDLAGNVVGQATPPGGSFASVSAGAIHTCGVRSDGSVECWGLNRDLAGNVVGQATPPGGSFASVSAGAIHTCGVRSDGSVECWGYNRDLAGNVVGQATPPGGSFASVSAGDSHTCGVRTDGSVECWGSNDDGQSEPPLGTKGLAEPVPRQRSASTFRVGVMESLTGPGETYGNMAVQAKRMAVEEINAAGGINGRTLELIVEDSKCNRQDSVIAYNKLTNVDGVKIILGPTCGGAMLAVAPLAEADGVVLLSAMAGNPDIAEAGDYIFRTAMSDVQLGIDTGNALWADGIRKLGTISEATDYAEGVRRTSVAQFEKRGGRVVAEERYASDTSDFRPELTGLLGADPDAIHIAAQTEVAGGTIVKQARELGYDGPLYSSEVLLTATALEIAGEAATGMKAIVAELDPANDKAQEVLANFEQRYGYVVLPWHLGSAYDNVYITAECLKKTDDDWDADGFRDCLYDITWSGAIGNNYSFDHRGEVVGLSNLVVEVLPPADRTEENKGYNVPGSAMPIDTVDPASTSAQSPIKTFASVSAGGYHTCGVKTDSSVECWGYNVGGPATPPGGVFSSVSAGFLHTCGVKSDGSVECWGSNEYGQAAPPGGPFASVRAGWRHACGVRTDGSVECWGSNEWRGSVVGQATPPGGSFSAISAGDLHNCGARADGSIECWGYNYSGDATSPSGSFSSVSAGGYHTCGVRTDGSVECWGSNEDEDGNVFGQATPPGGSFSSVSAGFLHTCGVSTEGSVECWGSNEGEDGNVVGQATPPDASFSSVSAGAFHTCGVRTDGSVECWGSNEDGQATPP